MAKTVKTIQLIVNFKDDTNRSPNDMEICSLLVEKLGAKVIYSCRNSPETFEIEI